jgi:tripeptide aminopeptidase
VEFNGLNIHPGSAKDKMVNSQYIAMEFQSLLPAAQKPEHTEGYEGFIHLTDMQGEVEKSTLRYIIRDHDMAKFEEKKRIMTAAADYINAKYGENTCVLTLRDSYFNMKKCIEPVMYVVDRAKKAMQAAGMNPVEVPIRGGTDGARLSYEGLPCPNLCTGGENYHGRFEFIPVEDMEKCVKMLVEILTTVN